MDEKYKGFQKIRRTLIPILSLLITFLLLYLLFENIKTINEGDNSGKRYFLTIIESIALFVIPFIFNPKAVKKRLDKKNKANIEQKKDILDLKIKKLIKLNGHYTPAIILKCPKCGFINVKKSKVCYNCSYRLNWGIEEQNESSILSKCPKCGFINVKKSKVCYNCSNKLD